MLSASSILASGNALAQTDGLGTDCGMMVHDRATLSRDRLVLNGAPSALERIRLNQKDDGAAEEAARSMSATTAILMRSLTNRPIVDPIEPAARTALKLGEVKPQLSRQNCDNETQEGWIPPILDGDMDGMGTIPIAVRRTVFDERWTRVNRSPPLASMKARLQQAGVHGAMEHSEILHRVNQWVNRNIAYVSDEVNYNQRDYWASAAETLSRMSGDCEDYAVLKLHMLRAAGIAPHRIKLVLLRDLAGNRDHAFLTVSGLKGDQVLDNMTDVIYAARDAKAIRPVLSFSGNNRWVHAVRDNGSKMDGFKSARASYTM